MKTLEEIDVLYKVVEDNELSEIVGGKRRKLPKWVKYACGAAGIIGELAEPGSVNWKGWRHR